MNRNVETKNLQSLAKWQQRLGLGIVWRALPGVVGASVVVVVIVDVDVVEVVDVVVGAGVVASILKSGLE